jgi:hypothetical protein
MPQFTDLCKDEIANILSFIPVHQRWRSLSLDSDLQKHFQMISSHTFENWDLTSREAKPIVSAITSALDQFETQHHALKKQIRDRFVRLVVVGLLFQPMHTEEDVYVCSGLIDCYFNNRGMNVEAVLSIATHFRQIKRLFISTGYINPLIVLLFQCMKNLKSIASTNRKTIDQSTTNISGNAFVRDNLKAVEIGIMGYLTPNDEISISMRATGDTSTFETFYLPGLPEQDLEDGLSGKCDMSIKSMVGLVKHCKQFMFSSKSLENMTRLIKYSNVYRAVVEKVNNGDTLHLCEHKTGEPLVSESLVKQMIGSDGGLDTIIRLRRDGIQFQFSNNTLKGEDLEICLHTVKTLTKNGVYLFDHLQIRKYLCHWEWETSHNIKTKHGCILIDGGCKNTLSQLADEPMIKTMCYNWTRNCTIEFFRWISSMKRITQYNPTIRKSIREYGDTWKHIVSMLVEEKETTVLNYLSSIEPSVVFMMTYSKEDAEPPRKKQKTIAPTTIYCPYGRFPLPSTQWNSYQHIN